MNGISRARVLGVLGGAVLSIGAFAATTPLASASHDVYPPGWNRPVTILPQENYDFRAGCGWNDSQRYWPDQTGCGPAKSHPMTYGPVIYQMNPQGERYHRVN
jgi:hypothetical protein